MVKGFSIFAVYMVLTVLTNIFLWRFFHKNLEASSKAKKRTYLMMLCYHILLLIIAG